ncbi:MAG: hypothetical protein IT317_15015 [Anaerolineales bacterium]|nr:hypothetical protein [Anaerolineales bacterium]
MTVYPARRRAPVTWGSLLGALVGLVVVSVATIYFLRAVEVTCHRGRTLDCAARETILRYPVWSTPVEEIKIARFLNADSGPTGIFAETESGEESRLTTSGLTADVQAYLTNAIHQFIFVNRDETDLHLSRPPTLLYPLTGGLIVLGLLLYLVVSAARLAVYFFRS